MKRLLLLVAAAAAVVAAARCFVFVDEAEYAIVTLFGRPLRTVTEAGLLWKAPYESVLRIDRRLQIYNPRPSEFLTREKKNLDLDVFVCWRVDEPRRFLETVADPTGAESRLHDLVWSELAADIGRHPLEAFVSTNAAVHQLDAIVAEVTTRCAGRARPAYGIAIVDVRLRRINLPAQVRDSVFQRMRAERGRIARQYRAEGEEEAIKIRAAADKERTVTLAAAYAEGERLRGAAEAEATRIYAGAHQSDPDFYELTRTLDAYRKFLDDKTTVLLSSDSDLLRHLLRPPAAAAAARSVPAAAPGSARPADATVKPAAPTAPRP